eukprot:UN18831
MGEHNYDLMQKIAQSMVGSVCKCIYRPTGALRAVKILPLEHQKYLKNEIDILKKCNHPNIIPIFKSLLSDEFLP